MTLHIDSRIVLLFPYVQWTYEAPCEIRYQGEKNNQISLVVTLFFAHSININPVIDDI